jgi:hypothetical protein
MRRQREEDGKARGMWSVFGGLVLVALLMASCSVGAPHYETLASASLSTDTSAASLPDPLATSVVAASGVWATLPMGHLDQPLNTFWQLMFQPTNSSSWSDQVRATAVATNGGLVLTSPDGGSLLVGVRPSNLLTFSPLIDTSNGRTWSNGLTPSGLLDRPDALAGSASGHDLALVEDGRQTEVIGTDGDLSSWRSLVTERQLASSSAGRACEVDAMSAVGFLGGQAIVGTSCARAGTVGLFAVGDRGWRALGPTLSSASTRGRVEVLGLEPSGSGIRALLGVAGNSGVSLVVSWTSDGRSWVTSAPLQLGSHEHLSSFGPARDGFYVLTSGRSDTRALEVAAESGASWIRLPAPPRSTSTVAFAPSGTVDALAARDTTLSIWTLASGSRSWLAGQTIHVPILFGSSQ